MNPRVQFETDLADLLVLHARLEAAHAKAGKTGEPHLDPKFVEAEDAFVDAHLAFVNKHAPKT